MARRTLLLIASILVAAIGTALIWLYVQGAETRAQGDEAQVPVYVSSSTVAAGTPANQVPVVVKQLPQSLVNSMNSAGAGVLTDKSQIKGWASTRIVAGLPLLRDQFQVEAVTPTPPVQL